MVEIKSMVLTAGVLRNDGMRMVAAFTATIGPVEVHHCMILKKDDGFLAVRTPFTRVARSTVPAVRVHDREAWLDLVRVALAEYTRLVADAASAEPINAGLRRMLRIDDAEAETLARAGV